TGLGGHQILFFSFIDVSVSGKGFFTPPAPTSVRLAVS
ncbi:MAG: hypothetical protein ACI9OD_002528, partial [Limisphaerales bacterium]